MNDQEGQVTEVGHPITNMLNAIEGKAKAVVADWEGAIERLGEEVVDVAGAAVDAVVIGGGASEMPAVGAASCGTVVLGGAAPVVDVPVASDAPAGMFVDAFHAIDKAGGGGDDEFKAVVFNLVKQVQAEHDDNKEQLFRIEKLLTSVLSHVTPN